MEGPGGFGFEVLSSPLKKGVARDQGRASTGTTERLEYTFSLMPCIDTTYEYEFEIMVRV